MLLPSVDGGQFVILTEHGNRKDIARTYGLPADPRAANARLIAAAPELLEALQMMLKGTQSDCGRICMPSDKAVIAAFGAIAKATGDQA